MGIGDGVEGEYHTQEENIWEECRRVYQVFGMFEGRYGIGYGNYGQESKCDARDINSGDM